MKNVKIFICSWVFFLLLQIAVQSQNPNLDLTNFQREPLGLGLDVYTNADYLSMLKYQHRFNPVNRNENVLMFLPDSAYTGDWDTLSSSWKIRSKNLYSYNVNGSLIESVLSGLNSVTNSWYFSSKSVFTYDMYGNEIEKLNYQWDFSTNDWLFYSLFSSIYDANGNKIEGYDYLWEVNINNWIAQSKNINSFDENGNLLESIYYYWDTSITNWIPSGKDVHTYNENGKEVEEIIYHWNASTNSWELNWLHTYTYASNGNIMEDITSSWDKYALEWKVKYKSLYVYNSNDYLIEINGYFRVLSDWLLIRQSVFEYDANGNRTGSIFTFWEESITPLWFFSIKSFIFWSQHEVVSSVKNENILPCQIRPNPATDALFIDGLSSPTVARIYSANGALLHTMILSGTSSQIHIQNLPDGMYILHLQAGSKTAVKRFVKQ